MIKPCHCTAPGFCPTLGRTMPPARFRECRDKPEFREMFGREAAAGKYAGWPNATAAQPKPTPRETCRHKGGAVRTQQCQSCAGTVELKIFACEKHRECTLAKPVDGLHCCATCEDHDPNTKHKTQKTKHQPTTAVASFTANRSPRSPNLLVNSFGHSAAGLWSRYRGASCFLLCGGPSLSELPLWKLARRGVLTAAVNQSAATHLRPQLWFCADTPAHFHTAIWSDPGITKFCKRELAGHKPRVWNAQNRKWVSQAKQAREFPDVWFYEHGFGATPENFLTAPRVLWGFDYPIRPGVLRQTKSVMLVALRILYWLGVRTVYLCGADFKMQPGKSYAFDERKDKRAAAYNNNSYNFLGHFFRAAGPKFAEAGFRVVNVTPGSQLDAFERMDFEAAVQETAAVPPVGSVKGLYTQ